MSPEAAAEMGRIGAVAAMALAAIGSAIGTYLGGAGAVGAWKKLMVQGKPAPFTMITFVGAPLSQTIYGMILMITMTGQGGRRVRPVGALGRRHRRRPRDRRLGLRSRQGRRALRRRARRDRSGVQQLPGRHRHRGDGGHLRARVHDPGTGLRRRLWGRRGDARRAGPGVAAVYWPSSRRRRPARCR